MLFLYVLITPGYFQCILNFVSVILSFFSKHIARMLFLYVLITPGYFQCILNFVSVILSFFSICQIIFEELNSKRRYIHFRAKSSYHYHDIIQLTSYL